MVLEEYGLGLVIPGMVMVLELALGFGWVVGLVDPVSFDGGFLSVSVVFLLLVGLGVGLDVFGFSGLLSFFLGFSGPFPLGLKKSLICVVFLFVVEVLFGNHLLRSFQGDPRS